MTTQLLLLCLAAFSAGFIDAIVGGGGLVQTPSALVLLPQLPVATVIGTLKIPACTGTFLASIQYAKRVSISFRRVFAMALIAGTAAFTGSLVLLHVSNRFMKPFLLFVLVLVAVYTWTNKNFGIHTEKAHTPRREWLYMTLISVVIGFYDGFIGPGAGSFLVLSFISILGFDFLRASAYAKFVNLATNLGSIILFATSGKIIYTIALPMAICNGAGGWCGARLALLKGNAFIRVFFLLVVIGTILRFAYDVFFPCGFPGC